MPNILEDEIENLPQIKEVDIRGAQKREVEVAVDVYKMMAAKVSFQDVIWSYRKWQHDDVRRKYQNK